MSFSFFLIIFTQFDQKQTLTAIKSNQINDHISNLIKRSLRKAIICSKTYITNNFGRKNNSHTHSKTNHIYEIDLSL